MTPLRHAPSLLLVAILACGGGASTTTDPPGDPGGGLSGAVVRNGIEYEADVRVMESFPVQLAATVTVANRGNEERTVTFSDGCLALLRVYRPDGGAAVWDQSGELACTQALVPVTLAPGESRELQVPTVSAYEILGDALPDGTYRIVAYVRVVDDDGVDTIEIDAGTTQLAVPLPGSG